MAAQAEQPALVGPESAAAKEGEINGGHAVAPGVIKVSQVSSPPVGRANPGPLGLFGFALTTFVLGLYECGAG